MKTLTGLFTSVLLSGWAAMAVAQSPSMALQGPEPFAALDYNHDGVISEQEFKRFHGERMNTRSGQGMPMSNRPDAPAFTDLDRDGNGSLSEDELTHYQQMRQQGRRMMAPARPGPGGRNMPGFAEFDLNRDGLLEKEEFIEARGQRVAKRAGEGRMMRGLANMPDFETIDGNGDGRISPEEFYRHQSAHRMARPANRP